MKDEKKLKKLTKKIKKLYKRKNKKLLFHGWHHIYFVFNKSEEFAQVIGANEFFVKSAALVHDLNFFIKPNSEPEIANKLRHKLLSKVHYENNEIQKIEDIIMEAHTANRGENLSLEAQALSDADSVFKILPTTPILFSSKFITENKIDIKKLANKISSEQNKLLANDIYFYTDTAKRKYLKWARANLALWNDVHDALDDRDIEEMLEIAKKNKVI